MPRKIPMRKCVITNQRVEKKLLFRIVKTPDGTIIYDHTGKANGRGAYLTKSKAVIEKAKKTQILNRHLETEIPDSVYRELLKELENE